MKVFTRRYFLYGIILGSTSFFAVPKSDTYISMVYNGTSSGINTPLGALVCLAHHSSTGVGLRTEHFHGRLRHWYNVFEFNAGRKMREVGGSGSHSLCGK
jgi:hypothetical protein